MPTVKYKSGNNWVNVTTSGSIATDSTYGYVKVATDADVAAGTDNTAAITAKQLHDQLSTGGGLVHIQGAETIEGQKTFTTPILRTHTGSFGGNGVETFRLTSSDGKGYISNVAYLNDNKIWNRLKCDNLTSNKDFWLDVVTDDNGDGRVSIGGSSNNLNMTPSSSTSLNYLATIGWVNNPDLSQNVVHRTGNETIGGTKTFSDTIQGTAYRALWGDLAEYYLTDTQYPKGTLVQFGGEREITIAKNKVNAVITSEPGFILNSEQKDSQAIALIGRVPVRVIGKVKKFDKIALSYIDGVGCVNNDTENPIGIALENKDDSDEGLIICSVKIDLV